MKNIIERLKILPADERTEKFSIALSNLHDNEGDFLTIDVLCNKQYVKEVEKYLVKKFDDAYVIETPDGDIIQ